MQAEYHESKTIRPCGLTSWTRISEMFLDNLPKMYEIGNINCATHFELDWEYITTMVEKIRELLWPTLQPFMQNGELCFICCSPFGPKGT